MEGRAYAGGVDPGKVFLRKYLMVRGRATFASALAATPSLKRTRFLFLFCPLRTDDAPWPVSRVSDLHAPPC